MKDPEHYIIEKLKDFDKPIYVLLKERKTMTIYLKNGIKHNLTDGIDMDDNYLYWREQDPSKPYTVKYHKTLLSEVKTIRLGQTVLEVYSL